MSCNILIIARFVIDCFLFLLIPGEGPDDKPQKKVAKVASKAAKKLASVPSKNELNKKKKSESDFCTLPCIFLRIQCFCCKVIVVISQNRWREMIVQRTNLWAKWPRNLDPNIRRRNLRVMWHRPQNPAKLWNPEGMQQREWVRLSNAKVNTTEAPSPSYMFQQEVFVFQKIIKSRQVRVHTIQHRQLPQQQKHRLLQQAPEEQE